MDSLYLIITAAVEGFFSRQLIPLWRIKSKRFTYGSINFVFHSDHPLNSQTYLNSCSNSTQHRLNVDLTNL